MKVENKIECINCGAIGATAYTVSKYNAMIKAGFELRHLACASCGQQTLRKERI